MFSHIKELFTRPSGYSIAKSVRLRSSASAYFNRTPSTNGSQTTWTWSNWVKRGTLGTVQRIFNSVWGTTDDVIRFTASDTIDIYINNTSGGRLITSAVYRDPSAWYHIVVVWNSTNATSSDRLCLYVNGVRVTAFSTASYPTQNYTATGINSANSHMIGRYVAGSSEYFDGYLTEINFIDGQALTPSSFGETDSITGVWKAKKYSGTYGTNGFYLNFSDNSSNTATTIGKDYSGNGNNWTPNNISVTAGVTYDSMVDSPTVSAVSSNYCVLNPLSDTSVTLSEGNLKGLTIINNANTRCNSTIAVSSGKWYFETYLGVAGTNTAVGIGQNNITDQYPANDALSFAQEIDNARKGNNNTFTSYGTALVAGDIFMCAFDLDNNKIFFGKNGTWFNSSDPSAGTSPAFTLTAGLYTPIFRPYGNTSGYIQANFGQRPFSYTPPTGFVALNTYNLPASTIKNGAAYMAATTYSGTGSAQNITNSGSFQPDFVWIKNRGGAYGHGLVDSVRGRASVLYSNDTAAQGTSGSTQDVTAFNSNGFALGTNSQIECNASGQSYIGWQWKAGGTSSSNTNGSITSSVSANTTAGFSVVSFTSPASGSFTVGHGLNAVPNLIITKPTSRSAGWVTYHSSLNGGNPGTSYFVYLNTTAGQASLASPPMWGSAVPTSSVFGASVSATCAPSEPLIAYCFAAVAGYSAFGSYTGNGSTDGPFVYTGFRPRFILVKSSSGAFDWHITDTSRSTYNQADTVLFPNSSAAESNGGGYYYDLLSNGFKCRNLGSATNGSGATYIFAAFAESPFKTSLAR